MLVRKITFHLVGTVISPVHDGWVEVKGISRGNVGGRYMDAYILQLLEQQQNLSMPLFKLNRTINSTTGELEVSPNKAFLPGGQSGHDAPLVVHPSYDAYMHLEMARYSWEVLVHNIATYLLVCCEQGLEGVCMPDA